jgi:hypothetical protein
VSDGAAGTLRHKPLVFAVDRISALRRTGFKKGTRETLGEDRAGGFVLQSSILGLKAVDELDQLVPRFAVQEDADEIRSPAHPQAVELEQAARHGGFGTELAERDLGFEPELIDRWHMAKNSKK